MDDTRAEIALMEDAIRREDEPAPCVRCGASDAPAKIDGATSCLTCAGLWIRLRVADPDAPLLRFVASDDSDLERWIARVIGEAQERREREAAERQRKAEARRAARAESKQKQDERAAERARTLAHFVTEQGETTPAEAAAALRVTPRNLAILQRRAVDEKWIVRAGKPVRLTPGPVAP